MSDVVKQGWIVGLLTVAAAVVTVVGGAVLNRALRAEPGPGNAAESLVPVPAGICAINDTFQCATFLPFGAKDSDELTREARYYQLRMDRPSLVTLTLNPMPNSRSVDVRVYDAEYTRIAVRRFKAGQPGGFQVNIRQAGAYYVELDPSACCSGTPDYTLAVSR